MEHKNRCILKILIAGISLFLLGKAIDAATGPIEKIVYAISPVGVSEYSDWGKVVWEGKTVNLTTFRTHVMGFVDVEKIYSDPVSLLPLRVERDITKWLGKEYIIEEYDVKKFTLTIKKFIRKKKVEELVFKEDAPFQNAILLPFSLRYAPQIKVGWSFVVRLPNRFRVTLVSMEDIETPAGTFKTYHFTSTPNKFEIWISKDNPRMPIKIKGMGGLGYTLVMKEHGHNH